MTSFHYNPNGTLEDLRKRFRTPIDEKNARIAELEEALRDACDEINEAALLFEARDAEDERSYFSDSYLVLSEILHSTPSQSLERIEARVREETIEQCIAAAKNALGNVYGDDVCCERGVDTGTGEMECCGSPDTIILYSEAVSEVVGSIRAIAAAIAVGKQEPLTTPPKETPGP